MLLLLLCCLYSVSEIRAEEAPPKTLYGLRGGSVCLDPGGQPPYKAWKWIHNNTKIASQGDNNPSFKRINLIQNIYTLCIQNLAKADSGLYTFHFERNYSTVNNEQRLVVQDPVPKPALSISKRQVNVSAGLCTFAVNCSVHSQLLWTECDRDGCHTPHKPFTDLNITVSVVNGTVTCTGNNHVSSQEDSQDANFCFDPKDPEVSSPESRWLSITITIAAGLLVVTLTLSIICAKNISTRRTNQMTQSEPLEHNPAASIPSSLAEACYESDGNPRQNEQSEKPDTVYCMLEPVSAPASSELRGDNETEDGAHCHDSTVYSVVRKPRV